MNQDLVEAFISVRDPAMTSRQIVANVRRFCSSIDVRGSEVHLGFGEGRAFIKSLADGILLGIYARDILVFTGIKTVMETGVHVGVPEAAAVIQWRYGIRTIQ